MADIEGNQILATIQYCGSQDGCIFRMRLFCKAIDFIWRWIVNTSERMLDKGLKSAKRSWQFVMQIAFSLRFNLNGD